MTPLTNQPDERVQTSSTINLVGLRQIVSVGSHRERWAGRFVHPDSWHHVVSGPLPTSAMPTVLAARSASTSSASRWAARSAATRCAATAASTGGEIPPYSSCDRIPTTRLNAPRPHAGAGLVSTKLQTCRSRQSVTKEPL